MTKVLDLIYERLRTEKLHMTLLDPDKQSPENAAAIASSARDMGTDAVMIGGSTGVTQQLLDDTIEHIKGSVHIPVILFPTTARIVSLRADAIYFMSLLNSRNPKFMFGEQMRAASLIKSSGLEAIPMGYIIVEPGMKAGLVGEAELIHRNDTRTAVGYSVAAELLGMRLIYLEAGSGSPEPVPSKLISAVSGAVGIPLIVGGGIRDPETALEAVRAGADIIVTGTVVEQQGKSENLGNIIRAVKSS